MQEGRNCSNFQQSSARRQAKFALCIGGKIIYNLTIQQDHGPRTVFEKRIPS
jgi:hypothetical protein